MFYGARTMDTAQLRIALFSGNYNYVRDGANGALNRLVGYLLRQGAAVRVYSATTDTPAFEPTGDLVSLPSVAFPGGRGEYRFPIGLSREVRADLAAFAPNIIHISSPDISAHRAVSWARERGLPVLASIHTRFETYLTYYGIGFLEPVLEALLRRLYNRCDALVAPSQSVVDLLLAQGMNRDVGLWTRGVDREIFNPGRRSMAWRREMGIADDEFVIGFLGRLVMEKGLDVFAETIAALRDAGLAHRVLVVGDGPAREWFAKAMPGAVFAGFLADADLARAVAGMDVLFNPSVTEAFGNVTLEAMACGLPVVAAHATGASNLVEDAVTGRLVAPGDIATFTEAFTAYATDPALRARHGGAGNAAAQGYDWDAINQAVADAYLRVIARRTA